MILQCIMISQSQGSADTQTIKLLTNQLKPKHHECLSYRFDSLFSALGDELGGEVRQLLQVGIFAPHSLRHHLGQLHGSQSR